MSQGRQVTRSADRALCWFARVVVVFVVLLEESCQLRAHSRVSAAQTCEFQHQYEPDYGVIQQRPDSGAVREDDIPLQKRALFGRNARLRQEAEPRVDSIRRLIVRGESGRGGMRIADSSHRPRVDLDTNGAPIDPAQLGQSEWPSSQLQREVLRRHERTTFPARTTVRQGLKPIQKLRSSRELTFQATKSAAWPRTSVPHSLCNPRARAALRVTPASASSAVSPNRRVPILIASSKEVDGV